MYGPEHSRWQELMAFRAEVSRLWRELPRYEVAGVLCEQARHAKKAMSGDSDHVGAGSEIPDPDEYTVLVG